MIEQHRKDEPYIRSHYYSTQKMYWRLIRGMDETLFEAYLKLLKVIEEVHTALKSNPEAISKTHDLLIEMAMKLEEIGRQLENPQ